MTNAQDQLLSLLVRDEPRVLTRITALFGRRGYNIKSLSVGTTEHPGVSRMTIVVHGDRGVVEQAIKQLEKLHDVVKIIDHSLEKFVDRELVLVKVAITPESRVEVRQIAEDFRSRIVDVGRHALTFEVTGDEGKLTAFIEQMRPFGILETMRTGRIALTRGSNADVPSHVYHEGETEALKPVMEGVEAREERARGVPNLF
ncbi:acetolactate synthase-1/3 small subunit [Deinococcus metalli]|uniref:Acetolactate synthase small subunit n=1 Tax=Deinococcus metalli TaxID=1141878 RepID=A0A7W8KFJ4_9DEIO|nr:acetolactate synthase small subunit [Deinococcus metalli]MBB5377201.1 acetolactate synthase-1/3 small subunit [Deinococcus metalli]GHF48216.1 acetolactate synthase small subunit [Deinococcus metalli]